MTAPGLSRQIIAAAIGMAGGFAVLFVGTFGLFVKPLVADLHWSRTEASLLVTIGFLGYALAAPVAGTLFDRIGPRPVLAAGVALFAAGLAALGLFGGGVLGFAIIALLIGASGAATAPSGYILVLSKLADRRLGLTLGLAMLGLGVGVTLMPVAIQALITAFGWRNAYLAAAGLSLALGGGALLLGFGRSYPIAMPRTAATPADAAGGLTLGAALRSWRFWLLGLTALLVSAIGFGVSTHVPAILTDRGVDAASAARAAGLAGAGLFAGRIGAAVLMDRIYAPLVAFGCAGLGAVGMYLLASQSSSHQLLTLAPLLVGLLGGSEGDTMPYLTRRYFGTAAFGSIYGCIIGLAGLGGMAGPIVFGQVFDRTGSYTTLLHIGLVVALACGIALTLFGPYRYAAVQR